MNVVVTNTKYDRFSIRNMLFEVVHNVTCVNILAVVKYNVIIGTNHRVE